ncbi:sulfotransferase domain-containing protein [Sedimentitalea sp.]|uniref:sulfotransferase domain-containing protein n=1 Tax=Sedimentitalea sp. TaxID=2048915 RepID=UPI00329A7C56
MGDIKSFMALSMHKAGSSITQQILTDFAIAKGYEIDLVSHQVSDSPMKEADLFRSYQDQMRLQGVYYGVARGPYVRSLKILDRLKTIIQIRDPRDCLISGYFSFTISHPAPRNPDKQKNFERKRAKRMQMTADEFALDRAENYRMRMQILADIAERHDDCLMLKYEEMVTDTSTWLNRISEFLEQPLTNELIAALGEKIDFNVSTEDVNKKKRQVTPGDHARKLQPETITALNDILGEQMARYGYTV